LYWQWHPDKNLDKKEEAAAMFRKLSTANTILTDSEMRSLYDRFGNRFVQAVNEQGEDKACESFRAPQPPSFQANPPASYHVIPIGTLVSVLLDHLNVLYGNVLWQIVGYEQYTGLYTAMRATGYGVVTYTFYPWQLFQQHIRLTIFGLQDQQALNGHNGTALFYDARTDRYSVRLDQTGATFSVKPGNCILASWTVARIAGLIQNPELNGNYGTILSWNNFMQRYRFQLSAHRIVHIKAENVRL
jgi:curved DNA-binding protein CbpA